MLKIINKKTIIDANKIYTIYYNRKELYKQYFYDKILLVYYYYDG